MEYTYSVSEFLEFTNLYLEGINEVVVCGEISSIKLSQNKWFFITVKDEASSMEVFAISAQNNQDSHKLWASQIFQQLF